MPNDERFQHYSGRRIDTHLEAPWVILPLSHDAATKHDRIEAPSFEKRWNEINQVLLVEADAWGKHGRDRSVMGEYLEELAKKSIPESLKAPKYEEGKGAGIIDVVITLGKTIAISASGLREPRRKLHEDYTGKGRNLIVVPEELRPKRKEKIVAEFQHELLRERERAADDLGSLHIGRRSMHSTATKIDGRTSRTVCDEGELTGGSFREILHDENQESRRIQSNSATPVSHSQNRSLLTSSPIVSPSLDGESSKSTIVPSSSTREHPEKPKNLLLKSSVRAATDSDPEVSETQKKESAVSSYSLRSRPGQSRTLTTPTPQGSTAPQSVEGRRRTSRRMSQSQPIHDNSVVNPQHVPHPVQKYAFSSPQPMQYPSPYDSKHQIAHLQEHSESSHATRSNLPTGTEEPEDVGQSNSLAHQRDSYGSPNITSSSAAAPSMEWVQKSALANVGRNRKRLRTSRGIDREAIKVSSNLDGGDIFQNISVPRAASFSSSSLPSRLSQRHKSLSSPDTQASSNFRLDQSPERSSDRLKHHARIVFIAKSKKFSVLVDRQKINDSLTMPKTNGQIEKRSSTQPIIGSVEITPSSADAAQPESKTLLPVIRHNSRSNVSYSMRMSTPHDNLTGSASESGYSFLPQGQKSKSQGKILGTSIKPGVRKCVVSDVGNNASFARDPPSILTSTENEEVNLGETIALSEALLECHPRPKIAPQPKRTRSESMSSVARSDISGTPNQPSRKKQRPASRSMSARELSNLFDAHEPSMEVDESLGISFIDASRSSRNPKMKLPGGVKSKNKQIHGLSYRTDMEASTEGDHLSRLSIKASMSKMPLERSLRIDSNSMIGKPLNMLRSRSYRQSSHGRKAPNAKMAMSNTIGKQPERSHPPEAPFSSRSAPTFKISEEYKTPPPSSQMPLGIVSEKNVSVLHNESITVDTALKSQALPQNERVTEADSIPRSSSSLALSPSWKPNATCQNSVLAYACSPDWPDVQVDKKSGSVVRSIRAEREGVFRASGVLMGVRFVLGV